MKIPRINPTHMRRMRGLTPTEFWEPLGVKQSTASRYEHGRIPPDSVLALVVLRYGTADQKTNMLEQILS